MNVKIIEKYIITLDRVELLHLNNMLQMMESGKVDHIIKENIIETIRTMVNKQ